MPDRYYCTVPVLRQAGWSDDQIRDLTISSELRNESSCVVYNRDYAKLSVLNHEMALEQIQNETEPDLISCLESDGKYEMIYEEKDEKPFQKNMSIVPEWELLCERTAFRSNVQVALSIGKFFGASSFGIISDK
jgi:hypothetical protein